MDDPNASVELMIIVIGVVLAANIFFLVFIHDKKEN